MPHKIILFFLIVFSGTSLFSQNINEENRKLIDDWCNTAYNLRYESALEANKFAVSADSLSRLLGYKEGEADAKVVLGILAKNAQNYNEAIALFQSARKLRENIDDFKGVASCDNNLGNIERGRKNFEQASKFYHAGIAVMTTHQVDDKLLGTILSNLAMVYNSLEEHNDAMVYIDSSMVIRIHFKDTLGMAYTKLNRGKISSDLSFSTSAIQDYQESLALFKKKKNRNGILKCMINIAVLEYEAGNYEVALSAFQELLGSLDQLAKSDQYIVHKNIATIFRRTNHTTVDSSLFHYKAAMELLDEDQHQNQADLNYHVGWLHFQEEEYETSIKYLEESKRFLDSISTAFSLPLLKRDVLYKLSENYAKTNQFKKAFLFNQESMLQQDSLSNKMKEAMNYKMEIEMLKRNKVILQKENERLTLRNYLIFGAIITFLIGLLYRFKVLRDRKQERIDHQQKIDSLLTNQEIKVLKARLDGQDAERIRVGQDLHDRLGVMLSTIKLYFQSVEEKLDNLAVGNKAQFKKATDLLDDACDEVRKIAHDMQSSTLTHFGLQEELKELAEKLKSSQQIDVKVITFGMKERINNKMEFELYKMITELVGNALKHSKASALSIGLNQFDELINIIIEDDGEGFELQQLQNIDGTGLKNIETRVLDLHGQINIDSEPGRGTAVSIDIPYPKKDEL